MARFRARLDLFRALLGGAGCEVNPRSWRSGPNSPAPRCESSDLLTDDERVWECKAQCQEATFESVKETQMAQKNQSEGMAAPLAACNPFAREVVPSDWEYPDCYRVRPVCDQLNVLARLYPRLDATHVGWQARRLARLPIGAELLQVVPKPTAAARAARIPAPYGSGYGELLEVVLGHIGRARLLRNCREGQLDPNRVRILHSTREHLRWLETETPGDFLLIPMQSGLLHRGSSDRRSRVEIDRGGQLALSPWEVGHHLLSHPERIGGPDQLFLSCAGAEYDPVGRGMYDENSLFFCWDGDRLTFGYGWTGSAVARYGAASAFPV